MENFNFSNKEVFEKFESGKVDSLSDLYLIEDTALYIKDLLHKLDIQKIYKEKRVKAIDNEMKTLSNKIEFYKKVIYETLVSFKEKNIKFPDSCKVSIRKGRKNWIIDDEEKLKEMLKEEKEDQAYKIIDDIKIIKKEADKVVENWSKIGKDMNGICHSDLSEPSVSISFEDEEQEDGDINLSVPVKEDYDNLDA
jgi:hypothetical protein